MPIRVLQRLLYGLLTIVTIGAMRPYVRSQRQNAVLDTKYTLLFYISSDLETRLIAISANIDRIGHNTVGGLHYRINRSNYHVAEFQRLLKLLQVGNIQTWTSYEQFVIRGLEPAFKYISTVGARILSLRDRLVTVSDTIEASALVGQSSATRYNTAVLRQVVVILVAVLAAYLFPEKFNWFGSKFQDGWSSLTEKVGDPLPPTKEFLWFWGERLWSAFVTVVSDLVHLAKELLTRIVTVIGWRK